MFADPGGVDTDPDPTVRNWIRPSKKKTDPDPTVTKILDLDLTRFRPNIIFFRYKSRYRKYIIGKNQGNVGGGGSG